MADFEACGNLWSPNAATRRNEVVDDAGQAEVAGAGAGGSSNFSNCSVESASGVATGAVDPIASISCKNKTK